MPTTVDLFARKLLGREETGWRVTGVDPEGIDLRCGQGAARVEFPAPVRPPRAARAALVQLAEIARR